MNNGKNRLTKRERARRQLVSRQTIPRGVRSPRPLIVPPTQIVRLAYVSEALTMAGAALYTVLEYYANGPYDHEVALGGGSAAGFAEWSNFYNVYRPLETEVDFTLVNNEAFPVIVGALFSDTRVGTALASLSDALSALENPYSTRKFILGAKGGMDRKTFRMKLPLWKIVGNYLNYMGNDAFGALFTANPSTKVYFTLIAASTTGSNLTNGVSVALTIYTTNKLYSRSLRL